MSQKCRNNLGILLHIALYIFNNPLFFSQLIVFRLSITVLIIAWSLVQVQQGPPDTARAGEKSSALFAFCGSCIAPRLMVNMATGGLRQRLQLFAHISSKVFWVFDNNAVARGNFVRPSGYFLREPGTPPLLLTTGRDLRSAGRYA